MNGRFVFEHEGVSVPLWFNNYSRIELAKNLLPEKDGFPAKPEEIPLLKALDRMAKENYMPLMKELIWAGMLGQAFGTDEKPAITRKEIAAMVATANDKMLYDLWIAFLGSIGINLEQIKEAIEEGKKKAKATG